MSLQGWQRVSDQVADGMMIQSLTNESGSLSMGTWKAWNKYLTLT